MENKPGNQSIKNIVYSHIYRVIRSLIYLGLNLLFFLLISCLWRHRTTTSCLRRCAFSPNYTILLQKLTTSKFPPYKNMAALFRLSETEPWSQHRTWKKWTLTWVQRKLPFAFIHFALEAPVKRAGCVLLQYIILTVRQQCTKSSEKIKKGEKLASFSADQYQRSRSRTGTDIDTLCGADLSHSPQVIPSSAEEVTGPAAKGAIRRRFQALNILQIHQQFSTSGTENTASEFYAQSSLSFNWQKM